MIFFFQAEDGIRDDLVTGVQTCALPISRTTRFRDSDKARALAARITELCEPGRQYKLMEVCGGNTHTIYKHGLEDYLPEQITLVHGPGCPVCVIPMGRVDDAMALAAEPDVIMTSFGDMMRVPGSNGSFFDARALGTATSMVDSPPHA